MRTRLRSCLAGLAISAGLVLTACRITPDEIARIETENQLLREQVQAMRAECEQYRQIDIGVEKPKGEPQRPPVRSAPGAR